MKLALFLFILLTTSYCLHAQFTDSTTRQLKASSSGSVNKTTSGTAYLLSNLAQFNIRKNRLSFNSNANWIYGQSPERLTNNDFAANANFNLFRHFAGFYYWGLMNYTASYSLNIKSQWQAGLGVAYNFIDEKNIWLNASNGFIAEQSNIIQKDSSTLNYQTIRNSLRVQFLYKFGDRFVFRTSNYYQPSLEYISDYILFSSSEINYKIWKDLSFSSKLLYNKVSRTAKENLLFTYGLSFDHYF